VPLWGRPPGPKGSKRRRRWERERAAWEGARVEELDSDDTDTQGVGLNFEKKRYTNESIHFTGVDLPSTYRARKGYTYDTDYSSESESDSEESDEDDSNALQIALRDKEEALVQSALARIRRAQEKGKSQVKLDPEELEALQRRRQRMQAAASTKGKKKKGSGSSSGGERKRRSERQLVSVPVVEPKSRQKGKSKRSEEPDPRPSGPAATPGMLVAGADGITYAPLGYYPQASSSRNSPPRPRSSTSQKHHGTTPPQFAYQSGQARHYSEGTRPTSSSSSGSRRLLPDEEDWVPNSRRGSASSQSLGLDPFEYQVDAGHPPPIPQQYIQGRRIVSVPTEVAYSSLRRSPPIGSYPAAARGSASDPRLRGKGSVRNEPTNVDSSSSDEDQSDDLGNGVQVFVEEREVEKERHPPRKPVASKKKGKGR